MPPFNFEEFKKFCEENKASPLVVIYGVPNGDGVDLNFLTTEVYDNADNQLKQDVTATIGKVFDQMKG